MNYNLLPDYSQRLQEAPLKAYYPISKTGDGQGLSRDADTHASAQGAGTYKYYVMSDARDMVYTRQKNTENLYSLMKGSLVNLYV